MSADLNHKVVHDDRTADRNLARMKAQERVETIYNAERNNIYTYLLYFGTPPARAQELAQDAFLKLHQRLMKGDPIDNPRAWLYRVAHNLALRSHEREPKFDELDPDIAAPDNGPDPERALIEKSRRSALYRAMQALSPQQRNCLHLRVQGLRYREIAGVIGISTSAVSEFVRRAAVRLKEAMNG